jgi:hypothetical protein
MLRSGAEIELWADAYSVEGGNYVFNVLVDATPEEQLDVRVCAETVPPSERVFIAVAIVPEPEVAAIEGGWSLRDDVEIRR